RNSRLYDQGDFEFPSSGQWFMETCRVEDSFFEKTTHKSIGQGPEDFTSPYAPGTISITVFDTPSPGKFRVAFGDGTFRIRAGVGTLLYRTSDARVFKITEIAWDGTYFVVSYDGDVSIAASDVLTYNVRRRFEMQNIRRPIYQDMPITS